MSKDKRPGNKRIEEASTASLSRDPGGAEAIASLLSFVMPQRRSVELARRLADRFGGLKGLLDATAGEIEEIEEVEGLDDRARALFALMKPLAGSYLKERAADRQIIKDHRDVINFLRLTLSGERSEKFFGLYLNSRGELLSAEVLHDGALTHALVQPRRVIELAIRHSASSVVFVHNQPDKDPEPTRADYEMMRALEEAAAAVDLTVHDHIIIGRDSHFSARARGWLFEGASSMSSAAEKDERR